MNYYLTVQHRTTTLLTPAVRSLGSPVFGPAALLQQHYEILMGINSPAIVNFPRKSSLGIVLDNAT